MCTHLSGIILCSSDSEVLSETHEEGVSLDEWYSLAKQASVTDVLKYPKKLYLSHLKSEDGNTYNYVAIATENADGIIFCYDRQDNNAVDENQLRIENLLAGYSMEMNGIILITDGEKILSSNDEDLIEQDFSKYYPKSDGTDSISEDRISIFKEDGTEYLARRAKCKNYYLYVFFPANSVFSRRLAMMAYALSVYIIFLFIIFAVKQRETGRTNRLKMEFLHQMSHDIRTPINGIRGMVRIGNKFPEDAEKQKECREKIWETSSLLLDLVNDVLDMGKLESGEMIMDEKPFNICNLMDNVCAVMESQANSQGIEFTADKPEVNHSRLIGSAVYLRRILVNIISNAVKYNREKGTVRVSCRELEDKSDGSRTVFEFVCADTGIGMSREFQKHMFEQFTQEKTVGEISHHGTGLGLSIVKSLLREMKGTIRCESETGKGTVFRIEIPFTIDKNAEEKKAEKSANPQKHKNHDGQGIRGITVMLVEDNEINMEIAEFILNEEGANVIKATDGREAVDIFGESAVGGIDVILMDIMMPVMDGEAAARAIRLLDRADAKTVPIIAMTANAFDEDIQSALKAGMNMHIAKPIEPELIKRAIISCIGER